MTNAPPPKKKSGETTPKIWAKAYKHVRHEFHVFLTRYTKIQIPLVQFSKKKKKELYPSIQY